MLHPAAVHMLPLGSRKTTLWRKSRSITIQDLNTKSFSSLLNAKRRGIVQLSNLVEFFAHRSHQKFFTAQCLTSTVMVFDVLLFGLEYQDEAVDAAYLHNQPASRGQ
jgi:hypothetical protein